LIVLTFETAFLGASVEQSIQPYQIHIDSGVRDCGALEIGCAIMNLVQPFAQALAFVVNGLIFLGALAVFQVAGGPDWVQASMSAILDFSLLWAVLATVRGTK
jgi:hypothetical protein